MTYLHFGSVGKLLDSQETLLLGLFGPHLLEMSEFEHETRVGNLWAYPDVICPLFCAHKRYGNIQVLQYWGLMELNISISE
jgi:hypothetical protein